MRRGRLVVSLAAALVLAAAVDARATAPAGQYVIANGTVVDTKTKLTWQQTVSDPAYLTRDAQTYCPGLTLYLGGSGWRLPTVKELATLLDRSRAAGPMIDAAAFPATPTGLYWTATPDASSSANGWTVDFSSGRIARTPLTQSLKVRCVRQGP